MKQRPRALTMLALLVLGIAVSIPVQIMIRFDIPPSDPGAIADKLAPLNWFVMILGVALAGLLYRAAPFTRLLAPVFLLILGWNNWLVAQLDPQLDSDLVLLGTAAVYLCSAVLLAPPIHRLLTNPALRWWLTPPRKKMEIPARVTPMEGGLVTRGPLEALTFDLSEGGVYISYPNSAEMPPIGAQCAVRLDLDNLRTVRAVARVVRHSPANGRYPQGFAVCFEDLPGGNLTKIKEAIRP